MRRSKGKEYLNVLDFIGNYEKAGRVRYLLTGKNKEEKQNYSPADKTDYPDDCFVDFDMKLIDLFAEMDKKQQSDKKRIFQNKRITWQTAIQNGLIYIYGR